MTKSKSFMRRKRKAINQTMVKRKLKNLPFPDRTKIKPKKIIPRFFNASYEEYKLRETY